MENKVVDETVTGADLNSQVRDDLGSENVGEGGANVVVKTKTVVESTKILIVERVGESRDDVLRREMEGAFGDFDYSNEGMDVHGFLANGNGNAVELGLAGEIEENEKEGRDVMDVGLSGEKEKNGKNGGEVAEAKEGVEKNDEGEVKNGLEVFEWNKDEGIGEKRGENGGKVGEKEEENDGEEDEWKKIVIMLRAILYGVKSRVTHGGLARYMTF